MVVLVREEDVIVVVVVNCCFIGLPKLAVLESPSRPFSNGSSEADAEGDGEGREIPPSPAWLPANELER